MRYSVLPERLTRSVVLTVLAPATRPRPELNPLCPSHGPSSRMTCSAPSFCTRASLRLLAAPEPVLSATIRVMWLPLPFLLDCTSNQREVEPSLDPVLASVMRPSGRPGSGETISRHHRLASSRLTLAGLTRSHWACCHITPSPPCGSVIIDKPP